jgi:hypothetical protein
MGRTDWIDEDHYETEQEKPTFNSPIIFATNVFHFDFLTQSTAGLFASPLNSPSISPASGR